MAFSIATSQGLTERIIEDYSDGSPGITVPDVSDFPFELGSYSRSITTVPDASVKFSTFAPIDSFTALAETNGGSAAIEFDIQGNGTEAGLSLWLYLAGSTATTDAAVSITPAGAAGTFEWLAIDGEWYSVDPTTSATTHVDNTGGTFDGIYVGFDRSWEFRRTTTPYPGVLRASGTDATLVRSPLNRYLLRIETSAEASYLSRVSAWQSPEAPTRPCVRMFPRSDGRGMSSAPRIHPAPSSQRVIGGHQ